MFHSFLIGFHWIGAPCIPTWCSHQCRENDSCQHGDADDALMVDALMARWANADPKCFKYMHMITTCTYALMLTCTHALLHSCSPALMLSCTHALMYSCTHAHMHSYSHALRIQMTTPWVSAHDHMPVPWHPQYFICYMNMIPIWYHIAPHGPWNLMNTRTNPSLLIWKFGKTIPQMIDF